VFDRANLSSLFQYVWATPEPTRVRHFSCAPHLTHKHLTSFGCPCDVCDAFHISCTFEMCDAFEIYDPCMVDLWLVVGSEMSFREKQIRHCDCGSDILIDIIHPAYHFAFPLCVYASLLIFVPTPSPSLQTLCLSLCLSLSIN